MLLAAVGLFGLAQLDVDSSYNAIWPFFILLGAGMALTMPAVSGAGHGGRRPDQAGIASGVVNASRQVGGAIGIAILGSVGATLASNAWADKVATLPQALQAKATALTPLVQGGQGALITKETGRPAVGQAALESFQHGVRGAFFIGACMLLLAAIVSFVGLRTWKATQAANSAADDARAVEHAHPVGVEF